MITRMAALAALLAAGAAQAAPAPRLHPLKAYTVVYRYDGNQTGTETEHSDAWGYRKALVTKTEMRMSGVTVRTDVRSYTIGDMTVRIDFATRSASRSRNPLYAQLTARMNAQKAEDFGIAMIRAMGYRPTGARKTIAGEGCAVWTGPTGETCFTHDAISLQTVQRLGGVSISRTATAVRRNDPGPATAYQPDPRYPVTDAPDPMAWRKALPQRPK